MGVTSEEYFIASITNTVRRGDLEFWVLKLCAFVGRYQRFAGIYCFHLQAALKIVAACSSEKLVSTYKFTWRYNPGDQHQHFLLP
jgi:hypothetical protein